MCNKRLKNVFQPNFSVTEKKFTNFLVPPVTSLTIILLTSTQLSTIVREQEINYHQKLILFKEAEEAFI